MKSPNGLVEHRLDSKRFSVLLIELSSPEVGAGKYVATLTLAAPLSLREAVRIEFFSKGPSAAKQSCLQQFCDVLRGLFDDLDLAREDTQKEGV